MRARWDDGDEEKVMKAKEVGNGPRAVFLL